MKNTDFLSLFFIFLVFMSSISSAYAGTYNQEGLVNLSNQVVEGMWNVCSPFWYIILILIGGLLLMKIVG